MANPMQKNYHFGMVYAIHVWSYWARFVIRFIASTYNLASNKNEKSKKTNKQKKTNEILWKISGPLKKKKLAAM